MIKDIDHSGRSIHAIHMMWKAKKNPATFPKVLNDIPMDQLRHHIKKWLFDTGYLNSQYYRSTYEHCEEIDEGKARALLGEIFCN